MDPNHYAAPASALETPTQGTVSMARYGVLCFVLLLVILTVYVRVSRLAGIPVGLGTEILCLLVSVQLAGWRFVRTHRRRMSPIELTRFALACAAAFWVLDEVPILIKRLMSPDDHLIVRVLIASAVDVAIAAAIVYVTVPVMARYLVPRMPVHAR